MKPLSIIRKGMSVRIKKLPEGDIRAQCIRIGLMEDSEVTCIDRLPGGTLILSLCRQEIVLNSELARSISVEPMKRNAA
jgi:ferrous iron transport protein A